MHRALAFFLLTAAICFADDEPAWVREAATHKVPVNSKLPAVVLLQEQQVSVPAAGRSVVTSRRVVEVMTPEGRTEARGAQIYITGTSKVRDHHGWVIEPSGKVFKLGQPETYDRLSSNDLYNEVRERGIDGSGKSEPGSIFAYEITTEDTSVFSQFEWSFQGRLPVITARCTLTLPKNWRADSRIYNYAGLSPAVRDSTYTWEIHDLPAVESEPLSPTLSSLVPRLAVSYFPPDPTASGPMRTFQSWKDVSGWLSELSDAQAAPNEDISAKAMELTESSKTELARIQALNRFVQGIKYISIQTGIGRGGGYKPHAAPEVFTRQYGDCKDKATLMRAMLKSVGIDSYMVAVFSTDRNYVRDDFPSPQQFNHAIVAIKVSPETKGYAVADDPSLGRLLFVDTTSNFAAGALPPGEQGGFGLVSAGVSGKLLRLPMNAQPNVAQYRVETVLSGDGNLSATKLNGNNWQPAQVKAGEVKNNRLMILKPPFPARSSFEYLTAPSRKYPVLLDPAGFKETVTVKLPPGFKVDEVPDKEILSTPFGKYSASCSAATGQVVCSRDFEVSFATIPVEQYPAVREFFQRIAAAEQAPVVLVHE